MQIKRFEAIDMTEALRLVKREFGNDAVILSAKEVRPSGFFSGLRKKSVEIMAATDYPLDAATPNDDFSDLLSTQLDIDAPVDQVSLSTPSAPDGHMEPEQAVDERLSSNTVRCRKSVDERREGSHRVVDWRASSQPQRRPATRDAIAGAGGLRHIVDSAAARNRDAAAHPTWAAAPFYRITDKRQVIALVGPPGGGKSTTVAKLARHCLVEEKKHVAIISLDRFRIGANSMLKQAARIMQIPLVVAQGVDQLRTHLDAYHDIDVVLIDSPGVIATDQTLMKDMRNLLREARADEIHLVANAAVREDVLATMVNSFLPLGVNRLLFTHVDEYGDAPTISNLLSSYRLPSSFFSDGIDLFDHLNEAGNDRFATLISANGLQGAQIKPFPGSEDRQALVHRAMADKPGTIRYVANRNSELFHLSSCKSVKRINAQNITAFSSLEQATQTGFKPCRACCSDTMVRHAAPARLAEARANAV